MVVVQVGEQEAGEKEAVAPVGRPEAEYEIDWADPEESVAVMVLVID